MNKNIHKKNVLISIIISEIIINNVKDYVNDKKNNLNLFQE